MLCSTESMHPALVSFTVAVVQSGMTCGGTLAVGFGTVVDAPAVRVEPVMTTSADMIPAGGGECGTRHRCRHGVRATSVLSHASVCPPRDQEWISAGTVTFSASCSERTKQNCLPVEGCRAAADQLILG